MVRVQESINNQERMNNQIETQRELLTEIIQKLQIGPCKKIGNKIARVAPSCLELQQELTSLYVGPSREEQKALNDLKTQLETIRGEENPTILTSHRNKALAICHYLSERL
ncbi:16968_t:CDS:2 [Gigaspora margarita]|uniref:16968_t:CDS:1 n=1 Tax=Gigaspora margarita TaxID=4874 RepID=A0ABM8VW67_GIGMA|nr:16968_t:CDS:2 [Gigaspora margarita]